MSKMAALRQMRGVAGDPAIPLIGGLLAGAKALGAKLLGGGALKAASLVSTGAMAGKYLPAVVRKGGTMLAGGAAVGGGMTLAQQLTGAISGTAPGYRRRRGRGITATELRGYRKVANLLHKVGMRPKATGRRSR